LIIGKKKFIGKIEKLIFSELDNFLSGNVFLGFVWRFESIFDTFGTFKACFWAKFQLSKFSIFSLKMA
jgi:hypothetical protein